MMSIEQRNYTVPEAIVRETNKRGMKQKAVAQRAGMSEQQLTAIITGRRLLTPVDILALSNALGCTPNDLFTENEADDTETTTEDH